MIRLIITLCCIIPLGVFGQGFGQCDAQGWGGAPALIDSTDFSGNQGVYFHYEIDTTLNNLWQVGAVSKMGFPASNFGNLAIQTDTVNSYDTSNISTFSIWTDSLLSFNNGQLVSLHFWHYYDVDSLSDSCIVQISIDSGATWVDYGNSQLWNLFYDYNIPFGLAPQQSGKFLWTGSSVGWQEVKICFSFFAIKPTRSLPWPVAYRFVFKSDSIQNNKPGWIIDKIRFRTPSLFGAVSDLRKGALNIFPNPSQDGIFHIDFPNSYVSGEFIVYDYSGRIVQEQALKERLDLSSLKAGMYFYRAVFNETSQWFSGQLEIE